MCWEFRVSFQAIFEIHKDESKSHSIARVPLQVIQQWPHKISLYIHTIPCMHKNQQKQRNFTLTSYSKLKYEKKYFPPFSYEW